MYGWCRLQWWCIVVTSSVGAGPAGQASTATWSLILSGVWTKPSHLHCSSPHCAGVMLHGHRDHGSWWSTITTTIQNYPVFIFWRIIEIVIWTLWPSVGFLFWPKDYCRMRWQQLLKPSLIIIITSIPTKHHQVATQEDGKLLKLAEVKVGLLVEMSRNEMLMFVSVITFLQSQSCQTHGEVFVTCVFSSPKL